MTIDEIRASRADVLKPADIAGILGTTAYSITVQARQDAESGSRSFPFPVIVIGTRTKIPRIPFLRSMGVDEDEQS